MMDIIRTVGYLAVGWLYGEMLKHLVPGLTDFQLFYATCLLLAAVVLGIWSGYTIGSGKNE